MSEVPVLPREIFRKIMDYRFLYLAGQYMCALAAKVDSVGELENLLDYQVDLMVRYQGYACDFTRTSMNSFKIWRGYPMLMWCGCEKCKGHLEELES